MVTLQIVPYSEIEGLTSVGRIRKLLDVAKENKIALLQGRLKKEEETELIKATMEEVNKDFKGIELAVLDPAEEQTGGLGAIRKGFLNMLLGDRQGLTVIGPANVVKQIKQDPTKIELLTKEISKKRGKKKK